MGNDAEVIKKRVGDPFKVLDAIKRASTEGFDSLTEDDLFLCKWIGIYTHRYKDMHPEQKGYFMMRLRTPGGFVNPVQLNEIAAITEQLNRGFSDITTRQTLQLHWCHAKDLVTILNRLKAVGISTMGACGDIMRNITGCPVAGVDRDEILDATPVVQQINTYFVDNRDFADLPRKYKLCITGCRSWCPHPEIDCLSFVGVERTVDGKKQVGFDVRVGGGLSTQPFLSKRLGVFVTPEQALPVAIKITEIYRDTSEYREKRHRARFKFLVADWGVEKLRLTLEAKLGYKLDDAPADYQDPPERYRDHVGVHAQKQPGLFYVGAPVLVGRITSAQMRTVARLAEHYGDGTIRLTNRQNILLLNIPESNVEKVLSNLADCGLTINAHPIRRSVVTCTGNEFCKLALTETKARSREIVEYLEPRVLLDEPLRIHITGCPNACAQYQIGHIGMMGCKTKVDGQIVDAYDIYVGGRLGQGASFNHPVLRKVPAADCKHRLEQLLVGYKRQRKGGETFVDFCARVGDDAVAKLLAPRQPAPPTEDVPMPPVPESDGPVFA